jgi:predicted Holliday junction resolvase-like endonuclease
MTYESEKAEVSAEVRKWTKLALIVTLITVAIVAVGCPQYKVYKQGQDGKAALKQAESEKLIQLEEAKANLDSQRLNAQAEVVRAEGAAEAIDVEAGQLTEQYIQYLWVRTLDGEGASRVYIPTEAGLPILEGNPGVNRP